MRELAKSTPCWGVCSYHTPEQVDVVRLVADFLSIENDFLELSGLSEALNHLIKQNQ